LRGHLRGLRIDAWVALLDEAGVPIDRPPLEAAMDLAWEIFSDHWESGVQFLGPDAARVAIAHLEDRLGRSIADDLRAQLLDAFDEAAMGAELHLTDGIGPTLRRLKDAGLRLGIICDVGFTASTHLRRFLDERGLLTLFDHWSFSDEVGAFKPSPFIFRHALDGLGGVAPEQAAHVGDIRRTDVAGAKGMGMFAVRYSGVSDDQTADQPEGDAVIADHAALPSVLGLG
jgi:HAD superfamily hydrolase (TIGR01549 family)